MSLQVQKHKDRFCSREYREFLSRQQCCFCKRTNCDPHHLLSRKFANGSDALCIPLCREHHNRIHGFKTEERTLKDWTATITLLQLEFLREKNISYIYPVTVQDFEELLRINGMTEPVFTKRKNR